MVATETHRGTAEHRTTDRGRAGGEPPPATPATAAWARRLLHLPILYKVLIANAAVVVVGAIAGTWVTVATMAATSDEGAVGVLLVLGFVVLGVVLSVVVNYVVLRAAFQPLLSLQRAAEAVRAGDLAARAAATTFGDPQVARLAATFNGTLDELARDRAELRSLASQVVRAQEEERKRISRELHDDTAQVLFAQLLRLTALKTSPSAEVRATAATLEEMTAEALEGVRRLALELRPPALDDLGLLAALGDLAQRYGDQLGIPIDYQVRGARGRLPAEVELVLYRVAQEALTNVAKHAGASRVWIDLDRAPDDVTLSVRDNGRGFDLASATRRESAGLGLGLFGMEERVGLVGGTFRIWSRAGAGTEIFAFIPLGESAPASARSVA
jgi:two-component system sensor histidine kinase UhpB